MKYFVKDEIVPCPCHEGAEKHLYSFLTSALDGGEWSVFSLVDLPQAGTLVPTESYAGWAS
jgi:hypothetical protein